MSSEALGLTPELLTQEIRRRLAEHGEVVDSEQEEPRALLRLVKAGAVGAEEVLLIAALLLNRTALERDRCQSAAKELRQRLAELSSQSGEDAAPSFEEISGRREVSLDAIDWGSTLDHACVGSAGRWTH